MTDSAARDRRLTISTARGREHRAHLRRPIADRASPPGLIDAVFEPFVTSKPQGLGLGLAICRSIIGAHGGRIWAANNPSHGATFSFVLPIPVVPPTRAPIESARVSAALEPAAS